MGLLHGAVLVHVHRLIDGTEGIVLRVDLKDGGNAGGGVRHALRADLRADKVEAAVVRNRVAQRDLIAVDRTGHDDLALAGLDVHLEEDSLRGHGMLGVIVVAVEQTHCIVDQLLVVFHSLLIGGAVLIRLLLQKAERLEHRLGVVLGDAGATIHGTDVDPVFIAQGGEGVGLAGVAGEALLDLAQHPGDLLRRGLGILGLQQLLKAGPVPPAVDVLYNAGPDAAVRVRVLIIVYEAVALAGGRLCVGDLFQGVAVVAVGILGGKGVILIPPSGQSGDGQQGQRHGQGKCGAAELFQGMHTLDPPSVCIVDGPPVVFAQPPFRALSAMIFAGSSIWQLQGGLPLHYRIYSPASRLSIAFPLQGRGRRRILCRTENLPRPCLCRGSAVSAKGGQSAGEKSRGPGGICRRGRA